jgi:hypothetical protein
MRPFDIMSDFLRRKGASALPRVALAVALISGAACDTNKLVEVQDPATLRPSDLNNLGAVPALVNGAFRQFVGGYSGFGDDAFLSASAVITDETYYGDTFTTREAADKRNLQPTVLGNISDAAFTRLQQARFNARRAFGVVTQFSTNATAVADSATKAQLRAIEGYVYLTLSEGWCGAVPFSKLPDTGLIDPAAIEFGDPLSTRAMNDTAVARFNEALVFNPRNRLVALGRARALLNLGRFAEAGAAVSPTTVPTSYVFLLEHSQNTSPENNPMAALMQNGRYGVSNLEGAVTSTGVVLRPDVASPGTTGISAEGLPFRGLQDPRVPWEKRDNPLGNCFSSSIRCWLNDNYPNFDADVPLASGVEARLIEAEAALQAGNAGVMMSKLNELRASSSTLIPALYPGQKQVFATALAPLADPADPTTSPAVQFEARRALLFTERALWLYNTGHRQGDLRRLVRAPYNLPATQVWPTGPHFRGGNYGNDVAYPVPFSEQNNPRYNPGSCSTTTA